MRTYVCVCVHAFALLFKCVHARAFVCVCKSVSVCLCTPFSLKDGAVFLLFTKIKISSAQESRKFSFSSTDQALWPVPIQNFWKYDFFRQLDGGGGRPTARSLSTQTQKKRQHSSMPRLGFEPMFPMFGWQKALNRVQKKWMRWVKVVGKGGS
jgi:hypothetical protein